MAKLSSLERKLLFDVYGKWLWILRTMPSHACHHLAGIALPPHERYWIGTYFLSYADNQVVASRGTSKSFGHGSVSAPLYSLLYKNMDTIILSASGFRGGKLLFEDTKRMVLGELRSQQMPSNFLKNSSDSPKVIKQEPDRWTIKWTSHSTVMTVPTNSPENLRGIRARKIVVDERNTFDGEDVQVVVGPMRNVKGEFRKVGLVAGQTNPLYQVSTIDYTFRDWWKEIDHARRLAKRQFEAMNALQHRDYDTYEKALSENDGELSNASFTYTRFDYTDLLITRYIEQDDKFYEIQYPVEKGLTPEDLLVWDKRDRCWYFYTYPVAKDELEEPLRNGTMDEDLWLAEQRNVFITASGNVYPDKLVRDISEFPIYQAGEVPNYDERDSEGKFTKDLFEFFPPVMYSCGDPCVLGVDYAREKDDFAVIVVRMGELANGKFDPLGKKPDEEGRPCYGNTSWNSVIWAESWPHTTAADAAEKIRNLLKRYNVLNASQIDTGYGGVGMDARGGGGAVRDELAQPKAPTMSNGLPDPSWREPVRIYDPTDDNFAHFGGFDDPVNYWSGLRLLTPTNAENWEWTRLTKAAMEQKKLWIGYWQQPSTWAAEKGITTQTGTKDSMNSEYHKWLVGYNGIKKLKSQLVRLQIEMTPSGMLRVMMPGKKGTDEGKKDLYSAFIYAWQTARQHLVNATKEDMSPPTAVPVAVIVGENRGLGNVGWGNLTRR